MGLIGGTREVVSTVREENLPFMAASIAFYTIASILPLLALTLALLSLFGAVDLVLSVVQSSFDGFAEGAIVAGLTATRGRHIAGAVGLLIALWSAIKVFRGLTVAFAEIYGEDYDLTFFDQLLRSLIVFGVLLLAILIMAVTSLTLASFQFGIVYPKLIGNLLAFVVLVVVALPLYYLLPPMSVTLWHALPGTLLAALGWIVLQVTFFYYAQSTGNYLTYGVLGGVLLFITFLYVAAIILLLGAVLNVVVASRGGRSVSHG